MPNYLALFDMDRTLLDINTAALYVRWRRRHGLNTRTDVLRVGLWMLKYKFGLLDASRAADFVMSRFQGDLEDDLRRDCDRWYQTEAREHVLYEGRMAVKGHKAAGAILAIVTSATRYTAAPLADELGISHVLCTELEVDSNGRFTGRINQPLCFGEGKAKRARIWAESMGFDIAQAYFYTDSITDAPLLNISGHPVAVNPDPRLHRLARTKGWPIEFWSKRAML